MGCNHKKREEVAEGSWNRKEPTVVKSDSMRVLRCKTCGAIRVDSFNEFCFSQGVWSRPSNKESNKGEAARQSAIEYAIAKARGNAGKFVSEASMHAFIEELKK